MKSSRRNFLATSAATAGGLGIASALRAQLPQDKADESYVARKGGPIKHSVMGWCFNSMLKAPELAKHCVELGMTGIEGISSQDYKKVIDLGLKISLVSGGHGFAQGPCNPKFHDKVVDGLKKGIELAADIGTKNVITFTGMRFEGMDDAKAAKRCVETWKEVLPLAEEKGITLVLEHLNSRDDSHPMKGHPGYFGDDLEFCIDLIKQVGSKHFKLLFDIYHVSIMNGDIIRRIRQHKEYIGHYHTAGNPGRGELDENQEINYPAVMREIVKSGYQGFVAHEFIPTWKDPVKALRHGVQVCDVPE